MAEERDRRDKIALMILEKASKGRKITKASIQKMIESSRTHIQFPNMLTSVNQVLEDVFGLTCRPIMEHGSDYVVISQFPQTFSTEDADHVRIIDFARFPVLAITTACINHSPLGKIDLAEFKAAAGESEIVGQIREQTGLTVDNLVKQMVDGGFFAIEDDVRGGQSLVKGPRLSVELPDEHVLETEFQEMLDRLRVQSAAAGARRPTPLGANTSA